MRLVCGMVCMENKTFLLLVITKSTDMKRMIFISFILVPLYIFSQEYSEVVPIKDKTAEQLYNTAHEWMTISFNSANDVIQLEDPVNKKLIAKGIKVIEHFVNGVSVPLTMYFTFITEFKEERFRYQIYPTEFISGTETEFTYELLKEVTTEEGLNKYYTSKGIKPWVIGKKQFEKNLESNKMLINKVDDSLRNIPNDLKNALIKNNDDW